MADAADLNSADYGRGGSNPFPGTRHQFEFSLDHNNTRTNRPGPGDRLAGQPRKFRGPIAPLEYQGKAALVHDACQAGVPASEPLGL